MYSKVGINSHFNLKDDTFNSKVGINSKVEMDSHFDFSDNMDFTDEDHEEFNKQLKILSMHYPIPVDNFNKAKRDFERLGEYEVKPNLPMLEIFHRTLDYLRLKHNLPQITNHEIGRAHV